MANANNKYRARLVKKTFSKNPEVAKRAKEFLVRWDKFMSLMVELNSQASPSNSLVEEVKTYYR